MIFSALRDAVIQECTAQERWAIQIEITDLETFHTLHICAIALQVNVLCRRLQCRNIRSLTAGTPS